MIHMDDLVSTQYQVSTRLASPIPTHLFKNYLISLHNLVIQLIIIIKYRTKQANTCVFLNELQKTTVWQHRNNIIPICCVVHKVSKRKQQHATCLCGYDVVKLVYVALTLTRIFRKPHPSDAHPSINVRFLLHDFIHNLDAPALSSPDQRLPLPPPASLGDKSKKVPIVGVKFTAGLPSNKWDLMNPMTTSDHVSRAVCYPQATRHNVREEDGRK